MRNLGEQWIVEIEGVRHMVKLCQSNPKEIGTCGGCIYHSWDEGDWCDVAPLKACVEFGYIVKDLGPVNEDGLLGCPFCGEYPKIIHPTENMPVVSIVHTGVGHRILLEFFSSEQQAIDAWNRRA